MGLPNHPAKIFLPEVREHRLCVHRTRLPKILYAKAWQVASQHCFPGLKVLWKERDDYIRRTSAAGMVLMWLSSCSGLPTLEATHDHGPACMDTEFGSMLEPRPVACSPMRFKAPGRRPQDRKPIPENKGRCTSCCRSGSSSGKGSGMLFCRCCC